MKVVEYCFFSILAAKLRLWSVKFDKSPVMILMLNFNFKSKGNGCGIS